MTFGPKKITLKLIYGYFPLGAAEKALLPLPQIGLIYIGVLVVQSTWIVMKIVCVLLTTLLELFLQPLGLNNAA